MFSAQLPAPVLFHPLKHHLGYIKAFVAQSPTTSETELKAALQTIGSSQLDLYMGPLPPGQIAQEVLQYLNERCLQHPVLYQEFLVATGTSYRLLTLSYKSDWVLRWGVVEARHVHLHPARHSRHTLRVKANVLKTAVATAIAAKRCGEYQYMDAQYTNKVRAAWVALPPVKDAGLSESLRHMLGLLAADI